MSSLKKLAEQSRLTKNEKRKPGRELTLDSIKPDAKGALVARYIFPFVKKSGISNLELAKAMNYPNHSTMSMIRTGQARLPLTKAPKLAEVLDIDDHQEFGLLVAENNAPGDISALKTLGVIATKEERELLAVIRQGILPTEMRDFTIWIKQILDE